MKATKKGFHPTPMLLEGGGDFNDSYFATEVEKLPDKDNLTLEVTPCLSCEPFVKHFNNGDVEIKIIVEHPTFRRQIAYTGGTTKIVIPMGDLEIGHNVEVTPIIIASKAFVYEPQKEFLRDAFANLSDTKYDVEKGQILGYGQCRKVKTINFSGFSQIVDVNVINDPEVKVPFIVDVSQETIVVSVQQDIYDNFHLMQEAAGDIWGAMLNSTLAYPAIAYAIQTILQEEGEPEEHKWKTAILNKLSEEIPNFDISNCHNNAEEVWGLTTTLLHSLMSKGFSQVAEEAK